MIPKFTIAKIMDEARIDEVVGEFVTLKRRGTALLGLCPFHNEKTPSFNVSVSKGIYKCFGCGKGGDSVNFLMEQQQLSYKDALYYLAKKYNVEIEEENVTDEQRKEEEERHSLQESLYIANAFAQRYFTDYMLHNEQGRIGLAYLRERGFDSQTIELFQLGFSPDGGTTLTEAALAEGYQLEILKQAGLTSSKENSKYDFFRNRVMFPIHNMMGKVLGFGGRIMIKDEKAPKYVNTPESEIYNKSKILYGIYQGKKDIRRLDECLLVEGYTDVISLYQAGVCHAAASSGTSLTIEQIRLIKRLTKNITVLYDGDAAGIKAALRGTDMILEEGMNVRIVILPDQEDPDSYVRSVGATAFAEYIKENKKDIILFKTSLLATEAKNDPVKKAELTRDMIESIARVPDPIMRAIYVKECAQRMELAEALLIIEVNKIRRKKAKEAHKEDVAPQLDAQHADMLEPIHQEQMQTSVNNLDVLEGEVVRLLMEYGSWDIYIDEDHTESATQFILEDLDGIGFETNYKVVYDFIHTEYKAGKVSIPNYFTLHEDSTISQMAIELLTSKYEVSENWWKKYEVVIPDKKKVYHRDILSVTTRLKLRKTQENSHKIDEMLREETDVEQITKLLRMKKSLKDQEKEYAKTIGAVVFRPSF
jgi:DNA primase